MADISVRSATRGGHEHAGTWFDRLGNRVRVLRRLARVGSVRRRRQPRWAIEDARMLRDIGIDPASPRWYRWLIEFMRH